MKKIPLIVILFVFCTQIFSQKDKVISLEECLDGAISTHPLQKQLSIYQSSLDAKNTLQDKMALPGINWTTQARVQSESIGLDFDNPNIPAIEIPLYSLQSGIDMEYTIYDGGIRKSIKLLNEKENTLNIEHNRLKIDQIKSEVISQYLVILFLRQRDKVLGNSLELIRDNIKTLSAARQYGVVKMTDLQQLELKEKELISGIGANQMDIRAAMEILSNLTGISVDENSELLDPSAENFTIDQGISDDKIKIFKLQQQYLTAQESMIRARYNPKVYTFVNAGTGYPNPLNFFDDQISLFAVGGIGLKWNIINWGAAKKEKQLISLQQDRIEIEKENTVSALNRYNKKYEIGIEKFLQLIENETEIIALKRSIADTQKSRLEEGVIIPFEYISNLNDIIGSELKLNLYNLEIIKLKLEYQLLKGQL
jgi:outer membrane protein TolC